MTNHDTKLIGTLAKAFINNVKVDNTYKDVLREYNLESIADDEWVSVKTLNEVMARLVTKRQSFESTYDMIAVGMAAASNLEVPAGMTFVDFLTAQNSLIQEVYMGKDKGGVELEMLSDTHYIVEVNLPWPDDLLYGNYYGFAKRFLPRGTAFHVGRIQSSDDSGARLKLEIKW